MKKFILTATTVILLLTSCTQKTETKNEVATEEIVIENVDFTPNVDISIENVSANEIKVTVKTNFPENTSLTITASRDYKRSGNDEQYAINLYYSFNSIVKDGEVTFSFNPNDNSWIEEYEALRKKNGEFDKTLTKIDNNSIKDTIEVSVVFVPTETPPENVTNILGANGENLNGIGVETNSGGFKVYDKGIKFYHKFQK